ncbi:thiamine phosphate synthase [Helicobacter sp. 11S02629-2]|uniref:thiamine phosphate synthase n=1 Tax=Helicobacter sp. 11S02629-2 TaxID=1476195 RepID=UPI000BA7C526|nr:thiamine phosphate synthase [Helicobacter sp. 11S02629-2]PAF44987.1 hypothetical protein BKH40_04710 [Helicobacter sp. 11S02629-2]
MESKSTKTLKGLYAISDFILTPKDSLPTQLEKALKAGVKVFQLRDKESKDCDLEKLIKDLSKLCVQYDAFFILNDRVKLALKLGEKIVHGLHVGKEDYEESNFKALRKDYKGIIGVSCYANLSLAKRMESLGADYVAFGAMFNSPTKPLAKSCPLEVPLEAKMKLKIPVCVIGGINQANVALFKDMDLIACISAIWQGDIKDNVSKLNIYKKGDLL